MSKAKIHRHLRNRGFKYYDLGGCECNNYYRKTFGDDGTVTIYHTKCANGERATKCPYEMLWYKNKKLEGHIDPVPMNAVLFDQQLIDWGLFNGNSNRVI